MFTKKNISATLSFVILTLIIYFLFTKQIVYPTILPMTVNGIVNLFSDWSVTINANICLEKGYDVYINNPCDPWNRKHIYGDILLYIPYIKKFSNFYFIYLPLILNLAFLYSIIRFFNFEDKIEYFYLFFIVLSTPVILVIERANMDIAIFLLLILISKNKNNLINHIVLVLTTLLKFYPISMAIIFLFKNNFKTMIINALIFLIIVFLIFFFQWESLVKILNNSSQFSGSKIFMGIYTFSFKGAFDFFYNFEIIINNKNYNFIKYLCLSLTIFLPLIITFYKNFRKVFNNNSISNLFLKNDSNNRMYILSTILILFCYFSFTNFIYREIFLIGLIPWLLQNRKLAENKFINFYFYILVFKFLISTICTFLVVNKIFPTLNPIIIFSKHSLDIYLISIIFLVFLSAITSVYKKYFIQSV
tara:strand:+ start:414 stop:1670 length:1257 start_codon:yes stop_codon:yes gene_type:complete